MSLFVALTSCCDDQEGQWMAPGRVGCRIARSVADVERTQNDDKDAAETKKELTDWQVKGLRLASPGSPRLPLCCVTV